MKTKQLINRIKYNRMTSLTQFRSHQTGHLVKRRVIAVIFAMIALVLVTSTSQAQTEQLDLKQSIQYALKANQTIRKAKIDVENSKYQIDEVRAGALPQVNGSGSLTYNPLLQLSALPGELVGQPGQPVLVAFG